MYNLNKNEILVNEEEKLIGMCKFSNSLFSQMFEIYEKSSDQKLTYENILEKISKNELHKKVEDKLYSKIENFEIFKDVVENIYPKIIERDRNN